MEQENINERLDRIERILKYIQDNMVSEDVILSKEEERLVEESFENERKGELISSEDLKKELGI